MLFPAVWLGINVECWFIFDDLIGVGICCLFKVMFCRVGLPFGLEVTFRLDFRVGVGVKGNFLPGCFMLLITDPTVYLIMAILPDERRKYYNTYQQLMKRTSDTRVSLPVVKHVLTNNLFKSICLSL